MSRDQRVKDNWALLHACEVAAKTGSPVAVVFNLVRAHESLRQPSSLHVLSSSTCGMVPITRAQHTRSKQHTATMSLTKLSRMQVTEYLHAGARQFGFMVRGLREMEPKLTELGIPFFLVKGDPTVTIPALVRDSGAALLVTDYGPLRLGRQWRDTVRWSLPVNQHDMPTCAVVRPQKHIMV